MRTSDLIGAALDWAVAKCEGLSHRLHGRVHYSTDWNLAGPIIEGEKIEIFIRDEEWFAYSSRSTPEDFHGPTPLIAAMRCYVASKLGDEIDVPSELI